MLPAFLHIICCATKFASGPAISSSPSALPWSSSFSSTSQSKSKAPAWPRCSPIRSASSSTNSSTASNPSTAATSSFSGIRWIARNLSSSASSRFPEKPWKFAAASFMSTATKSPSRTSRRSMPTSATTAPTTLPRGSYFVMGDHRISSNDSRVFGPVASQFIYGRAVFAYWPVDHFGSLSTTEASDK